MPALLIDVRSPGEFAARCLEDAINIEYSGIQELASRRDVLRNAEITLYCRSGHRSAIALLELQGLGFTNVRDIGGFEEARQTLLMERNLRNGAVNGGTGNAGNAEAGVAPTKNDEVQKSFEELLAGLSASNT
ncbi:Rhodanese-like domain-containing protein [Xylariales sp. AK1849]|nr:Rhodanese-like domain-containing protein [Xylariales sp. AK1849]